MGDTAIEWTDKTWNPVVGCTKISAGCKHCYAKELHDLRHKAFHEGKQVPQQYAKPFEQVQVMPDRLSAPLSWKKPARVFVNSVSDLFHDDVSDEFICDVFKVMGQARQHTFQVLTKRAERMRRFMREQTNAHAVRSLEERDFFVQWPYPNVWLGVSVENQTAADERIPHLLETPAAVRFLSCEPLLGPVRLTHVHGKREGEFDAFTGRLTTYKGVRPHPKGIDWVIVGGESGHNARPMHPAWARSLRDQCKAAGVAFFFKQWGEFIHAHPQELHLSPGPLVDLHDPAGTVVLQRVGKKSAGRLLDGVAWDEFPKSAA